ncbi:ribonuclease H [Putridiphycobacter roseus]|uniref:Ribonuclease H n=1 Tax=Putridiphycobacter roseus TaxID=2219161 RepID=A0A2W1MZV6_9FLAO|nr:ribonuclease H [Putridiphycobacter roseus]
MAKKKKFYVVWEGHEPGVYTDWNKAQKQVSGYTGAKFMSFENLKDAESAYKTGIIPPKRAGEKTKYYVVWEGHTPGIYTDWITAQKEIQGYPKPVYKIFGSKALAEKAFKEGAENYKGDYKKTRDLTAEELTKIGNPLELALCVDAACNGKGDFEYRGVWMHNKEEVFRVGPYQKGSNNIGEFLALVHALAFLKQLKDEKMQTFPIYSDSRIAMGWVKAKVCRTKQLPTPEVKNLINRAEHWLKTNTFKNPILKWETKVWGEIPADFGRK